MSNIKFVQKAWEDYLYWQSTERKTLHRINQLIRDIQRNPFPGIGKPERLKENLFGWWSRRIDKTNRIVYRIEDGEVVILQCRTHDQ